VTPVSDFEAPDLAIDTLLAREVIECAVTEFPMT
jgi:hypothetical protein